MCAIHATRTKQDLVLSAGYQSHTTTCVASVVMDANHQNVSAAMHLGSAVT